MLDVAIIGAGVVGAGVARELSRRRLDVAVFEKGPDAANGASRANSGIVHAGYDAKPGTLKARYNLAGNPMFDALARELDFPFRRNGSLVLAFGDADVAGLEELFERGRANGVPGLELLDRAGVAALEPNVREDVAAALHAPTGGIVCPYEMTIALAENAAVNGVRFHLECEVRSVARSGGVFSLETDAGVFGARTLVNAAGLESGAVNNLLSSRKIRIRPRRGEYCLLDKSFGGLARHTLFQLPGKMGKGVLVTPTVDGNILIGPTSEDVDERDFPSTSAAGLARVLELAARDVRRLPTEGVIASFAGLRAHSLDDDFVVGPSEDVPGLVNAAGIESPGLTGAPAISLDVARTIVGLLSPKPRGDFNPVRKAPVRFRHAGPEERARLVAENPDYGRVVCRCENVTKAEVKAALASPLGVRDFDALKRRTRIGMGRCQAGFCGVRIPEIIAEATGIPITEVRKSGPGSNFFLQANKEGR